MNRMFEDFEGTEVVAKLYQCPLESCVMTCFLHFSTDRTQFFYSLDNLNTDIHPAQHSGTLREKTYKHLVP